MKINEKIAIIGENIILVPYRPEHVEKYHEWMMDDQLRELTASEPLTLEEEYEMQRKWLSDEDKLTFIILSRERGPDSPNAPKEDTAEIQEPSNFDLLHTAPMIGDINLFLKGSPMDDDFESEVEIMIAEPAYRRKGFARQALELFLSYVVSVESPPLSFIDPGHLVVRIGEDNIPSIRLFEKLGFAITKRVEVFGELEMRLDVAAANVESWSKGRLVPC